MTSGVIDWLRRRRHDEAIVNPNRRTAMSHRTMTPFLRNVLRTDAVLSGITALVLMADAGPLAGITGLPAGVLQAVGAALVPWTALLAWLSSRPIAPTALVATVIGLNFVWTLDCALAAFGVIGSPSAFGVAVLAVQAIGTVVVAELEWLGLRRAGRVVPRLDVFAS
jgi:hypothetical protein